MSNELDLYSNGGQVVPWDPASTPSAPVADDWGSDVDYLQEHRLSPSSQDLPAHVEQNFAQINAIFVSDMLQLNHPLRHVEASAKWFKKALSNPPTTMPSRRSRYELFQYRGDIFMEHFALFAASIGMSQEMVQTICYWVGELEKRLDAMQNNGGAYQGSPPAREGTFNSNGQLDVDNLSDAAYDRLVAINETAKSRTTASLQRRWGDAYLQNLAAAQEVLSNLPASHQAYLSQYNPQTWVSGLSEEKTILGLFDMAVGGSLPSGAGIQREIDEILQIMRSNRKAYNGSPRLQARLRTLYDMRSGR